VWQEYFVYLRYKLNYMALSIMKKVEAPMQKGDTTAPITYVHVNEGSARTGALAKARQELAKMHGETDVEKVPYRIVHDKMYSHPKGYEAEIRLVKSKD